LAHVHKDKLDELDIQDVGHEFVCLTSRDDNILVVFNETKKNRNNIYLNTNAFNQINKVIEEAAITWNKIPNDEIDNKT